MKTSFIMFGAAAVLIAGWIVLGREGSPAGHTGPFEAKSAQVAIHAQYLALPEHAKGLFWQQSEGLTKPVDERLVALDQLTIGCFGPGTVARMSPAATNLGGQCCGVLRDAGAYEVQLSALAEFIETHGGSALIPEDPYDVAVAQAQQLLAFDRDVVLSAPQQRLYDEAVNHSHHGGPCCCQCWKWYMMSGLGKKLIVEHGFTAEQLAELWDLSSSCGHDEDTNMHQHYKQDSEHGSGSHPH